MRYYKDADYPEINEIDFVRVRALPLRDDWFQPWSWTAGLALKNEPVLKDEERRLDLVGNGGGGVSWGTETALISILAEAEVRTIEGSPHYAGGLGGSIDGLWQITPAIGIRPRVRVIENLVGADNTDFMADGTVILGQGTSWAFQISAGWRHAWELDGFISQATASWYW